MNHTPGKYRVAALLSPGLAAPYILQGLAAALEAMGHDVLSLDMRPAYVMPPDQQPEAEQGFKDTLREYAPDFVLCYGINGIMPLEPGAPAPGARHFLEARGIPYCCLFFDSPFFRCFYDVLAPLAGTRLCSVFIWDRYYADLFRAQCGPAHYLPLGTDPDRFRPQAPVPEFAADIAFIGSIAGSHDFAGQRRAQNWPDVLIRIADLAMEKMGQDGAPLQDVLEQIEAVLPPDLGASFAAFRTTPGFDAFVQSIYAQTGYAARRDAVEALAPRPVHVYGGPGWKALGAEHVIARGPVDYFEGAPRVYGSSAINLNISNTQLVTAVNQRAFDVPACGGFLLTDAREDAGRLFDPDREIAVFRDLDELKRKADYYLAHADERQAMAARARERVLREHTWAHRARAVIDVLRDKKLIP